MSKALKILSRPRGNAEEYGKWSVNPYIGCSHHCSYCYLKKGPSGAYLGQDAPVLKKGVVSDEHAYHLAMAEIIEHREEIIRDGGLFMTFTSDPMATETRNLFLTILRGCVHYKVPTMVLTKSGADAHFEYFKDEENQDIAFTLLSELITFNPKYVAFGWTLTGHDELEPNASSNAKRIELMKSLNDFPYFDSEAGGIENQRNIWASIEPVIDFPAALDMVYQAVNAGCQHFKIGLLTNNTRLVRKDFEFGGHHFDAYKVNDCLHFIEDVMHVTSGKATVYWKQSVRDLLETIYTPAAVDELLNYPHSVGKDWSMFGTKE